MKRATRKLLSMLLVLSMLLSLFPTNALATVTDGLTNGEQTVEEETGPATPPRETGEPQPAEEPAVNQTGEEEDPPLEQQVAEIAEVTEFSIDSKGNPTVEVTFSGPALTTFTIAVVPAYTANSTADTGTELIAKTASGILNPGSNGNGILSAINLPGVAYYVGTSTNIASGATLKLEDGIITVGGSTVSPSVVMTSARGAMTSANIAQQLKNINTNGKAYDETGNEIDTSTNGYPYRVYVFYGSDNSYDTEDSNVAPAAVLEANDPPIENKDGSDSTKQYSELISSTGPVDAVIADVTLSTALGNAGFKISGSSGIYKGATIAKSASESLVLDAKDVTVEAQDKAYSGTITITYNGEPLVIPVSITIPGAAVLETDPGTIAGQGQSSTTAVSIILHNSGAGTAIVKSITVLTQPGTGSLNVTDTNNVINSTIAGGSNSSTFTLGWSGLASSAYISSTLRITYSGGFDNENYVDIPIAISTSAVWGYLVAFPTAWTFTRENETKNINLKNMTTATLPIGTTGVRIKKSDDIKIENATIADVFEIKTNPVTDSVNGLTITSSHLAGGNKTDETNIEIKAKGKVAASAELHITYYQRDGAATTPIEITIPLSYAPSDEPVPILEIDPTTWTWNYETGDGTIPAAKQFTIRNEGTAAATNVIVNITGADASAFGASELSDTTIPAGGSVTATVTPMTQTTAGTYNGALEVTSAEITTPESAALKQEVSAPAPTTGSVKATLKQNTSGWNGATVYLSTDATSNTETATGTAASDGTYTFSDVDEGTYYVYVQANGATAEKASDAITVVAGETEDVEINYYGLEVAAGAGGLVTVGGETVTGVHYYLAGASVALAAISTSGTNPTYLFGAWGTSNASALAAPTLAGAAVAVGGANWTSDVVLTASFKGLEWSPSVKQTWTASTGDTSTTDKTIAYWNPGSADTMGISAVITNDTSSVFSIDTNGFSGTPTLDNGGTNGNGKEKAVVVKADPSGKAAGIYTAKLNVQETSGLTSTVDLELVIMNPAAFDVRVATKADGGVAANVGTVELVRTAGTGMTTLIPGTWNALGYFTFIGANWDNTYTVYVNGLSTGKTITNAAMNNTVEVKNLYTVGFSAASYDGDKSGTPAEYSYAPDSGSSITVAQTITAGDSKVIPGNKSLSVAANAATDGTGGASANEYYRFDAWTATGGGSFGDDAKDSTTFTTSAGDAASGIALTPSYQRQYQVSISSPQGSVTVAVGESAAVPYSAPVMVDAGVTVSLAAHSWDAAKYRFTKWTGGDTDTGSTSPAYTSKAINSDQNYTAEFESVYGITFNTNGGGTAPTDNVLYGVDDTVTGLPAITRTGYNFLGWAKTDNATEASWGAGATPVYSALGTPSTPGDKVTLYAVWQEITYSISGTITKNGAPWENATVAFDEKSATTKTDGTYTIAGISDKVSGTLTVNDTEWGGEPISINAGNVTGKNYGFYEVTVALDSGSAGHGSVTAPTGTKAYLAGANITVTASANNGYEYDEWVVTGNATATAPSSISGSATAPDTGAGDATLTLKLKVSTVTLDNMTGTGTYGSETFAFTSGTASTAGHDGDTFAYTVKQGDADTYAASYTKDGVTLTATVGGFAVTGKPQVVGDIVFDVQATSNTNGNADTATVTIAAGTYMPNFTVVTKDQTHYAGSQTLDEITLSFSAPYYSEGSWTEISATATDISTYAKLMVTPDTLAVGTTQYKFALSDYGTGYATVWQYPGEQTASITVAAAYTVKVTAKLDGSENGTLGTVTLVNPADTSHPITGTANGAETTFTSVPNGVTYDIYVDDVDTGVNAAVSSGDVSTTLNYYTVQFAATLTNGKYTSGSAPSGDTVLAGGTDSYVTLPDVGGIGNYELDMWSDNKSAGVVSGDRWTISGGYSGDGPIILTPTFKTTGVDVTVTLKLDNAAYTGNNANVELYKDGNKVGGVSAVDGVASFINILADTYNVYVGGSDTGLTYVASATATNKDVFYATVTIGSVTVPIGRTDTTSYLVTAKNSNGDEVIDGQVVLGGTAVIFELSNPDKLAEFDYAVTWGVAMKDGSNQAKSSRIYSGAESKPAAVTATLERNLYTVTGLAGTGISNVALNGTALDGAPYNNIAGSGVGNGDKNGTITFANVPAGTYTVGYDKAANVTVDAANSLNISADDIHISSSNTSSVFAIATVTSTYYITLGDDIGTTTGGNNENVDDAKKSEEYDSTPDAVTLTITSTGNTGITGLNATTNGDDFTFGTLSRNVLDAKDGVNDKATITVTPKPNLNAGPHTATITVKGDGLPVGGIVYTYTYTVTAKPLTAVTITGMAKDGETLSRDTVTATSAIADPDAAYTLSYQWQVSDNGSTDWAVAAGTGNTTKDYTIAAVDAGKYLRLAVTGSGNYSGTVYSAPTGRVAYTAEITINEDNVATDGYVVSLKSSDGAEITLNKGPAAGKYVTATGELDGDKDYDVYVQVIKGNTATETKVRTITPLLRTAELNYFTVNFNSAAQVNNHGKNVTSVMIPNVPISNGVSATVKTSVNDAANDKSISASTPVLSGTEVAFDVTTGTNTDWGGKDYKLVWAVGSATDSGIAKGGATSKDVTYNGKTDAVMATLDLQLYMVTGNYQAGHLSTLILVDNDTQAQNNFLATGMSGTSHVFNDVPLGSYTITATAKDGTVSVLGYNVTKDTTITNDTNKVEHPGATASIAVSADQAFAVVTDAARYEVTLSYSTDGGLSWTDGIAYTYKDGSGKNLVYGYATVPDAVQIRVKNTGNTALADLTLAVTDTTGKLTGATNGDTFDLAVSADKVYPIAIANGLNANTPPGAQLVVKVNNGVSQPALGTSEPDRTFTFTVPVEKAVITQAVLADLDQPVVDKDLDTAVTVTKIPADSFDVGNIVWTDSDTSAAAGKTYTATVTLTPKANYQFTMDSLTSYTLMGKAATKVDAGGTIILTYTFAPTAPDLSVILKATSFDTATAIPAVIGSGTQTVEYILKAVEGEPSDWTDAVTSSSFNTLASYTTYYIYARAKVTIGGVDSAWSEVAHASTTTFHKVTVKADGMTEDTPVGVVHDGTLALTPGSKADHRFDNWNLIPDSNSGSISDNTYTAGGDTAEITITANFVPVYHVAYNANGGSTTAPTDSADYAATDSVTLASYTGTKPGYKFDGWSLTIGGAKLRESETMGTLLDGTTPAAGSTVTIYARWTAMDITVTAAAMPDGTYGSDYTYTTGSITAKYNDGPDGTPGSDAVITGYASADLPLGLVLDTTTGAITGRPALVGDSITFTVTVTAANGASGPVNLTLKVNKATPTLTLFYGTTGETYYIGDALVAGKLLTGSIRSKAETPYWDPALNSGAGGWTTVDLAATGNMQGEFSFTAGAKFTGVNDTYVATFTPSGTGTDFRNNGTPVATNVLYETTTGNITIPASAKTYGFHFIEETDTTVITSGSFAERDYLGYSEDMPEFKFRIENIGNQAVDLSDTSAYVLDSTDFEIVAGAPTSVNGENSSDVITVKVTNANLTAGLHSVKLTVTDGNPESTANTGELTLTFNVLPKTISGATILGLVAPVKDGMPTALDALLRDSAGSAPDANGIVPYTIQSLAWAPSSTAFDPGTVYTATLVLKAADTNYQFAADTGINYLVGNTSVGDLTGAAVAIVAGTAAGGTVTYTVTFPATNVEVSVSQPDTKALAHVNGATTEQAVTEITTSSSIPVDIFYVVTTSAVSPSAAQIIDGQNESGSAVSSGMVGSKMNIAPSGGTATWPGISITGLDAGTQYYVHAVARVSGTATVSAPDSASFTTYYKVTVVSGNAAAGTIKKPVTGVVYVEPTKSITVETTVNKGYAFDQWTVSNDSGSVDGSFADASANPGGFTPTHNATVTATFGGAPVLELSGTMRTNQVSKDYPASLNIYTDARATNTGAGALKGNLIFKVVANGNEGSWDSAPEYDDFIVSNVVYSNGTPKLGAGEYATFAVNLKSGGGNLPEGNYTAWVVAYDDGNHTVVDMTKLEVTVVDGPAVNPVKWAWDLNPRSTTRSDWDMSIAHNGYKNLISLERVGNESETVTRSYDSDVDSDTAALIITESYLAGVAAETGRKAGDTVTYTLILGNGVDADKTVTLTLSFINTMPDVNGVAIDKDTDIIARGTVLTAVDLTAMAKRADGSNGATVPIPAVDDSKLEFNWYKMSGDSANTTADTVVQGPKATNPSDQTNSKNFTLTEEGKYYVVVSGISYDKDTTYGGFYGGSAISAPTDAAQYTVTILRAPEAGGTAPSHNSIQYAGEGGHIELTAAANTGSRYTFRGWSVSPGGGTFTAPDAGSAGMETTSALTTVWFWPAKTTTVTANFDLLPVLTISPSIYNVGGGTGNKIVPILNYTQNAGSGNMVIRIEGSNFVNGADAAAGYMVLADFNALNDSWMKANLGAGSYTIKVYDTTKGATTDGSTSNPTGKADYDVSVTLTIEKVNLSLPTYAIVENIVENSGGTPATPAYLVKGNTVKANPTTVLTGSGTPTYQWFYGDAGLTADELNNPAKATTIDGAVGQTLTIDNALQTAAKGKLLYVKVTGTGDYEGDVMATAGPVPVPTYTVNAASDGNGTAMVNGKSSDTVVLGGAVTLTAAPADGYVFDTWTLTTGTGTLTGNTFAPTDDATVTASFKPGNITFEDAAKGSAKYMTQSYISSVSASSSAHGAVFTYAVATTTDDFGPGKVPAYSWPTWLALDSAGNLAVDTGKWVDTDVVKDSTTEVTIYIKATDTMSGVSKVAKFTIDIIPGDLSATGPAYSGSGQTVGDPINLSKFSATVANNRGDTLDSTSAPTNGAWSVVEGPNFTSVNGNYTFRYTYKANADGSSNYNPTDVVLSIPANPPTAGVGVKEGDATTFTTAQTRTGSQNYGATATTYAVDVKNTGTQKIYNLILTATAGTVADFTMVNSLLDSTAGISGSTSAGSFTLALTEAAAKVVGAHTVTYTVSGNTAANGSGTPMSATYTLSITVTPEEIDAIAITDVTAPKTNETPDMDAKVPSNANYTAGAVTWDKGITASSKFAEGEAYTATVTVTPKEGYVFNQAALDTATFNGQMPTTVVKNGDGTTTLTYTFPATLVCDFPISVTVPADGGTPAVPTESSVSFHIKGNPTWTENGSPVTKFEKEKTYVLTTVVELETGLELDAQSQLRGTVNGSTTNVTIVRNSNNTATITWTYTVPGSTPNPGGGGGGATELTVTYDLQGKGTSKDALSETVASGGKPAKVPTVTANKGYTFKGWSQSDPSKTEEPKLVDPKTVTIKADTTFYAVYDGPVTGEHEHYIKGYDTGIFGPADDITRSQVAAIIARACLDGFHEDTDYGNGGYTDVANDHWARSAIAFVTEAGVFEGDGEGHFDPDRPITRQEFALVFARMAGLLEVGETPFSDAATTADWAMAGVYTAYAKGWLDGYNDGTFKPWNNIMRSEAVKIVNRYLNRGVNAEGIVDVYSELKQWSDVPSTYWAYYEILEASNDHTYFYADGVQPPEVYTKAYIEEASWGK